MPASFTPSNAIDMSSEKTWPSSLGLLDWDSTSIVFTKRSLIEFLKNVSLYTGTTVDPNFTTIAKLPRFAKFGKISEAAPETSTAESADTTTAKAAPTAGNDFRPSRRVRAAPGGSHTDIFGPGNDEDDALASAPPRQEESLPPTQDDIDGTTANPPETQTSGFRPSRRVRTIPGGKDSISSLWDVDDQEEFKPTRRVREGPGGQDNVGGLF